MRESFIFYKTFYECIKELPKKSGYALYNAIFEYVFSGEEPELSGIEKGIFVLMKEKIDANNKKYENGKLGGRPKKETIGTEIDSEDFNENENQKETSSFENFSEEENQKETKGFEKSNKKENQSKTSGFEKSKKIKNQKEIKTKLNINNNINNVNVNNNINKNNNKEENQSKTSGFENTYIKYTRFNEFYKVYPRKQDMLSAQGEYVHLLETTESLSEEDLISAAKNYAETCKIRNTEEEYIKLAANWLKASSWLDYLPDVYKKPQEKKTMTKNNFNNIERRIVITDDFERSLLNLK